MIVVSPTPRISVVIPVYNEQTRLTAVLRRAMADERCEITVVDGGSSDQTVAAAKACGVRVIRATRGRASQMNAGAAASDGALLLFLHGDTMLPEGYGTSVRQAVSKDGVVAGAFTLKIDGPAVALRIVERAANWRGRVLQMPYGDQAIFMQRSVFDALGGFAQLPVMEDYELVRRLRVHGRVQLVDASVCTSDRRWRNGGVWRTTLLNQTCIVAYRLGVSPERIAAWRAGACCGGDIPVVQYGEPSMEQSLSMSTITDGV
jgi:rSAM/selenodomain-associated transferase 2